MFNYLRLFLTLTLWFLPTSRLWLREVEIKKNPCYSPIARGWLAHKFKRALNPRDYLKSIGWPKWFGREIQCYHQNKRKQKQAKQAPCNAPRVNKKIVEKSYWASPGVTYYSIPGLPCVSDDKVRCDVIEVVSSGERVQVQRCS